MAHAFEQPRAPIIENLIVKEIPDHLRAVDQFIADGQRDLALRILERIMTDRVYELSAPEIKEAVRKKWKQITQFDPRKREIKNL